MLGPVLCIQSMALTGVAGADGESEGPTAATQPVRAGELKQGVKERWRGQRQGRVGS